MHPRLVASGWTSTSSTSSPTTRAHVGNRWKSVRDGAGHAHRRCRSRSQDNIAIRGLHVPRSIRLICSLLLAASISVGCNDSTPSARVGARDLTTAAPRSPFSGTFLFAHDPGEPGFEVTLEPGGRAWSAANGPGTKTRGRWRLMDGAARIEWDDGWRNELLRTGDGWTQKTWAPGTASSDPPVKTVPASKLR